MIKKIISLIFIAQLVFSCGFTPILKNLDNQNSLTYYEISTENSYLARQVLSTQLKNLSKNEAKFLIKIRVFENESAVNVTSSGSVDEYKIEVLVNFEIFNTSTESMFFKSQSRGFANYDATNSEYTNSLVKKEALERALTEAIQLMNIIIQSKIAQLI
ncbi:hypothetical protein N9R19_01125 [Pelagibacterales bacterium]|nr:hypothetical protein [Pelagibacterales bacterium]